MLGLLLGMGALNGACEQLMVSFGCAYLSFGWNARVRTHGNWHLMILPHEILGAIIDAGREG